jgi:hypothetical protein
MLQGLTINIYMSKMKNGDSLNAKMYIKIVQWQFSRVLKLTPFCRVLLMGEGTFRNSASSASFS